MKSIISNFALFVIVAAFVVAVWGFLTARNAMQLALSEITIEERSPLMTPVYDQATEKWSFLVVYEVNVTNMSGPSVKISSLGKASTGGGFLIPLKGKDFADSKLDYSAFLVEPSLVDIRANPRLLKTITEKTIQETAPLDIELPPGESRTIRFGVSMSAYDQERNPLADMVLLSFRLYFSNGKSSIFRRGVPIQPLK
ncbi:hypothetical protein JW935_02515 [candidate division KSB1 bacterium]|nr:hypothetical protein [candidate division KSB1 bacterium]